MAKTAPFDLHLSEYEQWFNNNLLPIRLRTNQMFHDSCVACYENVFYDVSFRYAAH